MTQSVRFTEFECDTIAILLCAAGMLLIFIFAGGKR